MCMWITATVVAAAIATVAMVAAIAICVTLKLHEWSQDSRTEEAQARARH
jgi:hypothetical protein